MNQNVIIETNEERDILIQKYMILKDQPNFSFDIIPPIWYNEQDIDEWLDNINDPEWKKKEEYWNHSIEHEEIEMENDRNGKTPYWNLR